MEHNLEQRVGVHSLQLEPYKNDKLIESTAVFINAGFEIANKSRYELAIKNPESEFNVLKSTPDVSLVAKGNSMNSVIGNAITFLNANQDGPTHVFTALSRDTPEEKVEQLKEQMDCFFYQLNDGTHVGYITIDSEETGLKEMNTAPFEMALAKMKNLDLDTVKYPTDPDALLFLPQFTDKNPNTLRNNPDLVVNTLQEEFENFSQFFEPHNKEMEDAFDAKLSRPGNNFMPDNKLRLGQ